MAGSLLASRVALFSAARLGLVHSSRASLATSAAPAAATASYCSTFDYRRERLRSGWGISTANEDVGEFCERLGQLSEVNWALNRNKVAPTGDAFRNLHLRGLRMLIPSVKDSSANCTVVPRADAASHKSFVVLPPSAPVKEGETAPVLSVPASTAVISAQESSALLRQLRVHLSTPDSPNVFLHDGSINSGTGERLLRAITDDATVALVLRHAILPAHLGSPLTFTPNATSFLSYTLPPPTSGVAAGAGSFSVLDLAANTLVMGGKFTSTQVLEALAALANFQVAQSGSGVPLPKCHSAVTSQGVSLVFGDSQPVICAQLFGAHNNVWSKDGIARSFNAAVVQPPPSKYTYKSCDLVEKPAKGSSRLVTSHKPERGFFAPHPNRVVFVVSDAQLGTGSLFTASSKQGAALFKRHAKATIPGIDTESLTNAFGELLESCKSAVYVVKAGKDEQQTIAAATTGAQAPKLDATAFSS